MKSDSLHSWLSWLEQSHPHEIELGLQRIRQVASRLDLLTPEALIITVAGTNGKGSCVAAASAILSAAGYSVGVYTSPHLLHYNERIVINNHQALDDDICKAFTDIQQVCEQESISLTYFEYGTLAAFYLFKKHQLNAWVLEVGLGGRLDAVNILDADIAIITSIDLDHQDWLGDTREKIGFEKAGIMRANRPIICADTNPPQSLIDHANLLNTESYFIEKDFAYQVIDKKWCWWNSQHTDKKLHPLPQLPLPSMAAALQMASILKLDFTKLDLLNLLAEIKVPGRFQHLFAQNRHWVMDVAHNPAATAHLAKKLVDWQIENPRAKIHALVAMMSDKDRIGSLANLQSIVHYWYLVDLSFLPRAATIDQLKENLHNFSLLPSGFGDIRNCMLSAIEKSQAHDLILVFGSFFTVAEAVKLLQEL